MLVGEDAKQEEIEEWASRKEQYYREMVKDKLEILPGVNELLNLLKGRGFKLAIGSSGPPENVELLVETLDIKNYFDGIITAAEVKRGKPHPDVFFIAANTVKVKPENCVVIEDAPVGIQAAKKANMLAIALTTTHPEEELTASDLIIQDLSYIGIHEILKLLNINLG